jgi:DNA-binding PadR family transcriptional regulator
VRSDTELLVLTLVERGVATGYSLSSQAGLSLGTTLPLLNRLTKASLIKIGDEGPRGRRVYSLTTAGRRVLESEGAELISRPPTDLDSALRTAFVAFPLIDKTRRVKFLQDVISHLRNVAEARALDGNRSAAPSTAERYRSMRRQAEVRRLRADIVTLEALYRDSVRGKRAKKSRSKSTDK